MDYWLGELIEEMRPLRLLENTVVVITADHGEGMGEHDYYFSHAQFVYTGLIHVPLLLRLRGPARAGHLIDIPVALVDVMPTILEQLKLEGPKSLNRRSLLHPEPKPILAVARRSPVQVTLISDGLKLNYSERRTQLYDLNHDFYETTDLLGHGTAERVQAAKTMRETFDRLLRQDALQLGAPEVWVTKPEDIQKLKTLGYVQ
jgi:arylsulfatase A-like enzyme